MVEIIVPVVAFGVIGAVSGVLLTVASKVFEVKTDERLEAIQEALPQINCGSCGFSGCNDYADAILGGAACNLCKPGGSECANKLGEIMGIGNVEIEEKVAFVKCKGGCDVASHKYTYDGSQSCKAANRFYNGSKLCTNGCLGFGDCVDACQENGICIVDGVAVVNGDKCVACGMCIKACPNNLIVLRPKSQRVDVACSSTAMGKVTRTVCKTGCIGCKLCEKRCPSEAIKIVNNVAVIDYSKCTNCGLCEESCKVGAIVSI